MLKGINCLTSEPLFMGSAVGSELRANPLGFIDIGARGGIHPLVEPLAENTAVLAFDLDEAECTRLRNSCHRQSPYSVIQILPLALAGQEGPGTLHRFSAPVTDSLRPENPAIVQRYNINSLQRKGTTSIRTTTLDKVLFERKDLVDTCGEFIKLDAQGVEWEVLNGAEKTLWGRTVAILVEVNFVPFYSDQKLFSEIEMFLRERGFYFYGFQGLHYRSCKRLNKMVEAGRERVFWADAVFFKDPLANDVRQKPLSDRSNYVLFACALLTGYYDFALEVALKTWAQGEEARRIEQLVHRVAHLDPAETYQKLLNLFDRVKAFPESSNFEVGRFVDERRHINDYDDVPPYRQR
ncbi:FkbM family methyltransferase [Thermodesulfobacteriota bacterium]